MLTHRGRRTRNDVAAVDQLLPTLIPAHVERSVTRLRNHARANRGFGHITRRPHHTGIEVQALVEEVIHVWPPFAFARFVGIADANLLEEGATEWIRLFAQLRHSIPVAVEHLSRSLVTAEGQIAVVVAKLGAKVPRLNRTGAWNPDRRVRLLYGLRPQVDVAQLGVLSIPRKRLAGLPCLEDQIVRFAVLVAKRDRVLPITEVDIHRRSDGESRYQSSA